MTSFRRVLSLPYAIRAFRGTALNTSVINPGALLTQCRCLFIKKAIKNQNLEPKDNKKHDIFQLNHVPKSNNETIEKLNDTSQFVAYSSLSDVTKEIQNSPLNYKFMKSHLFGMLKLYRLHSSSPDFLAQLNSFIRSDEFEKLALELEKSLPMLSTKYLYLIFQTMHQYQIPCSSILMQKLHALILDNINSFEIAEVLQMYLIVRENNEESVEAVKKAFLAYMNHLTVDSLMLSGNLKSMTYFASKGEIPFSVREIILKRVLSLESQLKALDPLLFVWLSYPLCSQQFQHLNKEHFLDALKETLCGFHYKSLKIILKNLTYGMINKVISYDAALLNCVALSATKFYLWRASEIMADLLKTGHVNYDLADAIAEKFIECDKESFRTSKFEEILCNLGMIDYKNYLTKKDPQKWCELEKRLTNYTDSGSNFTNIRTVLSLFFLGLNPKESVSKVLLHFSRNLNPDKPVRAITVKRACLLYQYYCFINSSPPENLPENFISDCLIKMKLLPSYEWEDAVYNVFKGEEYVLKKCKTPFGTLVSYAVIVKPDKTFLNLSSFKKPNSENSDKSDDFIEVEKIQRPPGSKVLAFIECGQEPIKFRNLTVLRPEIRSLNVIHKDKGYRIIHLFCNRSKSNLDDRILILSKILERELSHCASDTSESSAVESIPAV